MQKWIEGERINQTIYTETIHRYLSTIKTWRYQNICVQIRSVFLLPLLNYKYGGIGTKKPIHPKIIKDGWNRVCELVQNPWRDWEEWKNDNRVERHDRGGRSKRKPCGEYSQLLSASNKSGGGEQLELFQWFIFIDWNPSFLISPFFTACVLSDCAR